MLRDLFDQGRIAESVVVEENGESIGIIGATTPDLGVISSPRKVKIIGDVAEEVQTEVDRLEASGVNKIVLISHLQDIDTDIALLGQVQGVDVVVAGGGVSSWLTRVICSSPAKVLPSALPHHGHQREVVIECQWSPRPGGTATWASWWSHSMLMAVWWTLTKQPAVPSASLVGTTASQWSPTVGCKGR